MGQFGKRRYARLMLGAAVGALTLGAGGAWAQTKPITIAPQTLASALHDFGSQTGRPIMFSPSATASKMSPGVSGATDDQLALTQLLQGTGLTYRREGDAFVIVQSGEGGSGPQSGSAAGGGAEVEALIVTAQKREEDIQDVPIAISAFSQEQLTDRQVAGGPDLITQVPNMTFTKTNFSSYSIQLRGIGTQAISATTDPGVAVAFNNTPFIQNRFFEQEFYDLQRVEVLRGPQGTLYGRNATAGVVNIISQKPKFIAEAKLSGDVANYNSTRLEGMVNIPLVEDLVALRLAGAWTKREGFVTNELSGNPIDGRDLWSTRVSLRFAPTDALDVNLLWEHFEEEDDRLRSGKQLCKKHVVTEVGGVPVLTFEQRLNTAGLQGRHISVQPRLSQGCERESLYSPDSFQTPNGASVPYYVPLAAVGLPIKFFDPYVSQVQSRDLRVIESTIDPIYRADADLGELQVSWDVTDALTVASETAYATDSVYSLQDFNRFNTAPGAWCTTTVISGVCTNFGTNNFVTRGTLSADGVFCDPQLGCTDRLVAVDVSTAKSRQFNQEFRLSSDFEGPFNFSLGANFTRFDLEAKYYVFINSLTLGALGTTQCSLAFPYVVGVTDNRQCLSAGITPGDPNISGGGPFAGGYSNVYVEPNSIANIQDQGHNYFLSKNPYKLISYAMFGEAYYKLAENLKITAGLRWTVDKKEAPLIPSWVFVGGVAGHPVADVIEQEWREPTGRLAIDWKPDLAFTDETMVYASYAHGYKAGGANPPPFVPALPPATFGEPDAQYASETRPKTFDAEFIDAFELGAKNTLLDGRVTLNLAAFYYDYTGYQISEIVDRSAYNKNYDAKIWGLEIEADWRPLENLKLGFKGGYENTAIADGERAIDLMDRTAGNPDWVVVRPFPTNPSSCILPTALFTHTGNLPQANGESVVLTVGGGDIYDLGQGGGSADGGCERAYLGGKDPVTGVAYEPYPQGTVLTWPNNTYPGWDPTVDYGNNNGEGFLKDLGGNPLPNAPEFTATITADYTLPLPGEWLATLHTDLYWQSESNWRIFDDHEYNRLDEYFTMNVAAIFTNEDAGWKVMAYVKNVFDRDSITGAFLNSDDTGLTTNVFLTEPRLYGLRVTKEWTGGPLWGSFGARREGPYPFTLELGGQAQRHEAPNAAVFPSFIEEFSDAIDPRIDQQDDLDWGDGRDVKLTWRPGGAWSAALGVRFGKTNGSMPWSTRREVGDKSCPFFIQLCQGEFYGFGPFDYQEFLNYSVSSTADREDHTIVDFTVGMDVGFGGAEPSSVRAGLRHADLGSTTKVHIFGTNNWDTPDVGKYSYNTTSTHDRYESTIDARRRFKGAGPVLSWEASSALIGNRDAGILGLDWSVSGGVLFGERKTEITGTGTWEHYAAPFGRVSSRRVGGIEPETVTALPPVSIQRSEDVTVPTLGASLGLSYKVDRFSVGAGYRWERYQDAIDGGFTEAKDEDRTIDGPYLKISVGFGGG